MFPKPEFANGAADGFAGRIAGQFGKALVGLDDQSIFKAGDNHVVRAGFKYPTEFLFENFGAMSLGCVAQNRLEEYLIIELNALQVDLDIEQFALGVAVYPGESLRSACQCGIDITSARFLRELAVGLIGGGEGYRSGIHQDFAGVAEQAFGGWITGEKAVAVHDENGIVGVFKNGAETAFGILGFAHGDVQACGHAVKGA